MTVEVRGEAKPFLDAFHPPRGWTLEEPRVSNIRGVTMLGLQLTPHTPTTPTIPAHTSGGGS